MILPDLLKADLSVVFCGTAAGNKSAERKAYYAGRGNLFYPILASCRLTSSLLKPSEYLKLFDHNIGLTDLVKHHSGMDRDLKGEYYDVIGFKEKMLRFQPRIVCFNGKASAKAYFGLKSTKLVNYGLQEQTIERTKIYVVPSTSSAARKLWNENIWQELKSLIK